ncbi:hypothetical protein [Geodermatophilus sp. SYSU D00710]
MADEDAEQRVSRLEEQVRREHPRADDVLASAPRDPYLRAAALATVLELDALAAMRGEVSLDTLVDDRDARRASVEEAQRVAAEHGISVPTLDGEA